MPYLDPDGSHVAREGGEVGAWGEPVGEGHHDVECGQAEHDVEEGPRVGNALILVVPHVVALAGLWVT